jgi:hypothetical protein
MSNATTDSTAATSEPAPPDEGTPTPTRSPWAAGVAPGTADVVPTVARIGAATARIAASSAGVVSGRLASAVERTGGTPATPESPPTPPSDGSTAGQLINLGFQFAQVFSYGVFRFLEVLVGPLEALVDRDPTIVDDVHLVLGPVNAGERVHGTFELDNAATHDAEVSVVLPNALASVRGQIPADRVALTPSPASVPALGSATITVTVSVPTMTEAGRYLGIVRSDEIPDLSLILDVEVSSPVAVYEINQ